MAISNMNLLQLNIYAARAEAMARRRVRCTGGLQPLELRYCNKTQMGWDIQKKAADPIAGIGGTFIFIFG